MTQKLFNALGKTLGSLRRVPSSLWRVEAALRGATLAGPVEFLGRPILTVQTGSVMLFRGNNRVFSARRCNPLGIFQPCVLRTLNPDSKLEIGEGVGMSGAAICAGKLIQIGEGTIIGVGAVIIDNDFHARGEDGIWVDDTYDTARPIHIGRRCFIGARAIVLKGVTLGDQVTIGAGAVVTRDVPAGAIVAGNPARVVGQSPLKKD